MAKCANSVKWMDRFICVEAGSKLQCYILGSPTRGINIEDDKKRPAPSVFTAGICYGFTINTRQVDGKSRVLNNIASHALTTRLRQVNCQIYRTFSYPLNEPDNLARGLIASFSNSAGHAQCSKETEDALVQILTDLSQFSLMRYTYDDNVCILRWSLVSTEEKTVLQHGVVTSAELPTLHPAFLHQKNNSLFKTLDEAVDIIREVDNPESDELSKIVEDKLGKDRASTGETTHHLIVIEGLDGTGKSTLAKNLSEKFGAKLYYSPPPVIGTLRAHFDGQPDLIRRAYYTIGNYLAAEQIRETLETQHIIMDRFWHSTAAYTMASECSLWGVPGLPPAGQLVYQWPADLIKPSKVLLLTVPEESRTQRLKARDLTVTQEEVQLKRNSIYRETLTEAYRRMDEPSLEEVDASGTADEVLETVSAMLSHMFDNLS